MRKLQVCFDFLKMIALISELSNLPFKSSKGFFFTSVGAKQKSKAVLCKDV